MFGIEADIQYADLQFGGRTTTTTTTTGVFSDDDERDGYFGTVRGRLGLAFDHFLVYGTGGYAYGDVGGGRFDSTTNFDHGRRTASGYAAGGGVEYAFTNNITAKIEGLYVALDRKNDVRRDKEDDFTVVRAGLNFKFGTF